METWFIILASLYISSFLKTLFTLLFISNPTQNVKTKLPPRPRTFPVIGNLLWLRKHFYQLGPIIRSLRLKYSPLITLQIGSQPIIFFANHSLAHQALVENGAAFAHRPTTTPHNQFLSGNHHDITSAAYGSTWHALRRNLTSQILHPSHQIILSCLQVGVGNPYDQALTAFYSNTCDEVNENQIKQIESIQRRLVLNFHGLKIISFWPRLGKIVFRKRLEAHLQILLTQRDVYIPLISARRAAKQEMLSKLAKDEQHKTKDFTVSYADTLLDLHLPDENKKLDKKLDEGDIVSLCSEFLNAGTDTTTTALQWIMANLVKHPHIQSKLFAEIYSDSWNKDYHESELV